MKKKIISFVLPILFLFVATSLRSDAQEIPTNLLSEVPQALEKLNSDDVRQRGSILNELIKPVEHSCTFEIYFTHNLPKEDYIYVVRQILEKDLTALDEKAKPEIWSKLSYLISKYQMKEFTEPITAYLGEQMSVQAEIISVLRNLEAKEFDSKIAPLLNSPEKYIQRLTLETLISFRSKKAVPTLIAMLTGDNKFSEPYWAMLKLVEINGKEGSPQIAAILKDESPDMRYLAIDSLVKLNAKAQSKEIWQFLKSNTDKRLEGFAIAALIHLEQKEAIPLAVNHFKANTQGDENYYVLEFINKLKPKLLIPALISLYNSKEKFFEDEKQEQKFSDIILQLLIYYRTPDAIPIYRQNLVNKKGYNRDWEVNQEVASILGELNATEANEDLIRVFNDCLNASPAIYYLNDAAVVAVALAKLGDKRMWKQLLDFAEKPNCPAPMEVIAALNKNLDIELWKKTQTLKVKGIDYQSIKVNSEAFSRESGVPIILEFQPEKDKTSGMVLDGSGYPYIRAGNEIILYQAVRGISATIGNGKTAAVYTFIFDNKTIRILSVEKAIEWWRKNILK